VDYGTTLYAISESPLNKDILWAGSNDGLLHVTRDGGKSWKKVSNNISKLTSIVPMSLNRAIRLETNLG